VLKKEELPQPPQNASPSIVQAKLEGVTPQKTFTVMATTYDKRVSTLTITPHTGGEALEAWSNVNWNYLTSVSNFQGEEELFSMLLPQSNASLKEIRKARRKDKSIQVPKVPRNLPKLKTKGSHYTLIQSPSADQEEVLDFLEAIHNHYASKETELVKAYKLREKQIAKEKKEFAENPPKPENLQIIFWNNDSNL